MTTDKIKDGGPAFPFNVPSYSPQSTASYSASFPAVAYQLQPGMSLRDWFAGQALSGFIARCETDEDWDRLPSVLYDMADAMLKAREAQP